MGNELKPCPFCGGKASDTGHIRYSKPLDDTNWADGSPVTEAFFVNCTRCGVSAAGHITGGHQTKAAAVAAWNRRAPTPSPQKDAQG